MLMMDHGYGFSLGGCPENIPHIWRSEKLWRNRHCANWSVFCFFICFFFLLKQMVLFWNLLFTLTAAVSAQLLTLSMRLKLVFQLHWVVQLIILLILKRRLASVSVQTDVWYWLLELTAESHLELSCSLWSYCVAEADEKPLDLSQPVHGQVTLRPGKRPAVFLRYRDEDPTCGFIRIYPKGLRCVILLIIMQQQ